jgi:integrative and conjugative element protein (TIGR02256 family)
MVTCDPTTRRLSHLRDAMTSPSPHKVVMTPSAVQVIAHEAHVSADGNETGGILLGAVTRDAVIVRHAGGPGPNATRRPDFFQRDLDHAQRLGDQVFDADRSIWIGDWHTHLCAPPAPSTRDLATYQQLLADPELDFQQFVAVILAASDGDWARPTMAVWLVTHDNVTAVSATGHPEDPLRAKFLGLPRG